ncbi:HIT family protein [Parasutterella muris]|uniref:HIT family protein n=1 Tax=Parasutterella muris TaxID=2565572 RepID=UPI00203F6853|nr:HIT family protein [Parasutterella muris]
MVKDCPLCAPQGELEVVRTDKFRVIRVDDPDFPGYFRLIWNEHVKENSDLSEEDRLILWRALCEIERIMNEELSPDKINLAEFGTMVPHLHWHLIARYRDDASYPDSYWSPKVRSTDEKKLVERREKTLRCAERINRYFA